MAKPSAFSKLVAANFLQTTARLGPDSQRRVHAALLKAGALRRERIAREAAEEALAKAAKK